MGHVIVLALIVSGLSVAARLAAAQNTLTLGQAVAEALERNPDVRAAQARAAQADANASAARVACRRGRRHV